MPTIESLIDRNATFVINHSGGKDSQAMVLHLLDRGVPKDQMVVVHAVLPEADWDGIPEHIEATLPEGVEVHYVQAGKTFFDMVERRFESRPDVPSFPSPSTRQCTSDLKRGPIEKWTRAWVNQTGNPLVVHCIGIRAEESSSRAKADPFKFNKRASKAGREVYDWLPIHDWLETRVRGRIQAAGQELHWAYGAGMSRLSCCFCIMANQADLTTAARLRPALYQRYVELEKRTGYTMSMAQRPLEEVTGIKVELN